MSVYQIRHCLKLNFSQSMKYFNVRHCSYKPIKRPSLSPTPAKSKFAAAEKAKKNVALSKQLEAKILATGPITVADYMREVLTNPASGYYMLKDVFGEKGDFITSPEIGQIFGEIIAVWCISEWEKCGSPAPLQIVELGPGRGTLAQDILRVFAHFDLSSKISLHLVEISPHLSELQAKRLCFEYKENESDEHSYYRNGQTVSGIPVYWYHRVEDVPKAFSIYLAHEFFDALPVHKFQQVDGKWQEILIDIDHSKENAFRFISSKSATPMLQLFLNRPETKEVLSGRSYVEYSAETDKTVEVLVNRIEEDGGIGLIVDYGHFGDKGDTFRAFKSHGLHDPLVDPGSADLTADVDFKNIKLVSERNNQVVTFGPIEQKDFLNRMGGETRLGILLKNPKSDEASQLLKSGYDMLTSPSKMGSRFKFFAIYPKVLEEHLKRFPALGFQS